MKIDLAALFFSPTGRIGRLRFWIGALALFFLGDTATAFFRSWFETAVQPQIIDMLVALLLSYPDFCVGRKRLADRGKGLVFAIAYTGWGLIASLLTIFWPLLAEKPDGGIGSNLFLASIYTCTLFFIVECGFLRGTDGTNAFGPAPELP